MSFLKDFVKGQMISHSNVRAHYDWDRDRKKFILFSPAGQIEFKPRTERQLSKFRDEYINEFEVLCQSQRSGFASDKANEELFFQLYRRIMKENKVSYKANARTRVKCYFGI